jgi:hypothetical protein
MGRRTKANRVTKRRTVNTRRRVATRSKNWNGHFFIGLADSVNALVGVTKQGKEKVIGLYRLEGSAIAAAKKFWLEGVDQFSNPLAQSHKEIRVYKARLGYPYSDGIDTEQLITTVDDNTFTAEVVSAHKTKKETKQKAIELDREFKLRNLAQKHGFEFDPAMLKKSGSAAAAAAAAALQQQAEPPPPPYSPSSSSDSGSETSTPTKKTGWLSKAQGAAMSVANNPQAKALLAKHGDKLKGLTNFF